MIHVFFSASAAGIFRQMLHDRAISEEVVAIPDELDFGPITHGPLASREPWLNQYAPMDFGDHDWLAESEDRFRRKIARHPTRLLWLAPASAAEQAGLYWFLSHFGGAGVKLAIADFPFAPTWNGAAPLRLNELALEPMGQLYDMCPRISWDQARFPEDRWDILVADNALLRVVIDEQLRSVPDDYFDHFLMARCSGKWENCYRVSAHAMGDIWDTGQSACALLLLWRLRTLIKDGQIICDGDLPLFGGSPIDGVKIKRAG